MAVLALLGEGFREARPDLLARQLHQPQARDLRHLVTGPVPAEALHETAQEQLAEYFARRRREFDLPLNPAPTTEFRAQIHAQLDTIGYGEISSYGELAAAVGRPAATRAVGTACGANPLPIIRPCHRVLRSDGTLGGYAGGLDIKRFLLTLEEN